MEGRGEEDQVRGVRELLGGWRGEWWTRGIRGVRESY